VGALTRSQGSRSSGGVQSSSGVPSPAGAGLVRDRPIPSNPLYRAALRAGAAGRTGRRQMAGCWQNRFDDLEESAEKYGPLTIRDRNACRSSSNARCCIHKKLWRALNAPHFDRGRAHEERLQQGGRPHFQNLRGDWAVFWTARCLPGAEQTLSDNLEFYPDDAAFDLKSV